MIWLTGIACIVMLCTIPSLVRLIIHTENADVKKLAIILAILFTCNALRGDFLSQRLNKIEKQLGIDLFK
jgi:hypothetical protein